MKLSFITEAAYGQAPIQPRAETAKIEIHYWHDGDKKFETEEFTGNNRGMAVRRIKTLADQGYRVRPELVYRDGKRQPIRM